MLSMTGFGVGEAAAERLAVTVELRSVNHRFLDVAVKMPAAVASLEPEIRAHFKDRVARGRVSCSVQITTNRQAASPVSVEAIDRGLDLMQAVADRMEERGMPRPDIGVADVVALPDVLHGEAEQYGPDDVRGPLLEALAAATDGMRAMKKAEGAERVSDMTARLKTVGEHLGRVNELTPHAVAEANERLRERIAQLLSDQIDPQRLAQEAAILADRGNIAEECERLACHLDQFRQVITAGGQVAKRLNFLLQEMHREVNTMGSKTQNMEITGAVIAMKEEIESMREQVQNLE